MDKGPALKAVCSSDAYEFARSKILFIDHLFSGLISIWLYWMTTMVKQGQSSNAIAYLDYICKYIYACIPNTSVAFLGYNVVYFNSRY